MIAWLARTGRPSGELLRAIGNVWVWLLVRKHLRRSSQLWQLIESLPDSGLHTIGDRVALSWLKANQLFGDGDFAECIAQLDEAIPDARRTETPSRLAFILGARGISRPYSARARSLADFDEALNMVRDADDPLIKGYVLSHYGLLLGVIGETQRARAMHEEMLAIAQAADDVNLRAEAHYALALDAVCAGDFAAVEPHLAVAVNHYTDIDLLDGVTRCLGACRDPRPENRERSARRPPHGRHAAARETVNLTPWPTAAEAERRATEDTQRGCPAASSGADRRRSRDDDAAGGRRGDTGTRQRHLGDVVNACKSGRQSRSADRGGSAPWRPQVIAATRDGMVEHVVPLLDSHLRQPGRRLVAERVDLGQRRQHAAGERVAGADGVPDADRHAGRRWKVPSGARQTAPRRHPG